MNATTTLARRVRRLVLAVLALLPLGACASTPHDYGAYLAHMPRSVLVLPPLDESPELDADLAWLATVTRPIAERGYYVFPVALVQRILRDNGLPTAAEMHAVSHAKQPRHRSMWGWAASGSSVPSRTSFINRIRPRGESAS